MRKSISNFCALIAACVLTAGNVYSQQATPQWRPVYHFTSPKNWINDPNGLMYLNGKFQLYYQHNPFENKWGHMSWGHATSTDLVHWQHYPVAIPEVVTPDTTTWIFSGSAVSDKANTSKFGKNGKAPLVAIFTAHRPKQKNESQFLAYSNDNGLTYTLYDKNPVLDLNKADFRDPNVFWHNETKQWIMTVATVDEHMVRIYASKDLKQWTKLSDFGPAGYIKHGWECPSLLRVAVEGKPATYKWVMFVSCMGDNGPLMQYWTGDFDGQMFTKDNDSENDHIVDYGDTFYAAIAWRDVPRAGNILLGWLMPGKQETSPWKGQMSIPRDLALRQTADGLRLIQRPSVVVAKTLSGGKVQPYIRKNIVLNDNFVTVSSATQYRTNTNRIDAEFLIDGEATTGINIAETADGKGKIIVGYDAAKHELFVDFATAGSAYKPSGKMRLTAPMNAVNGLVKISILTDKSSLEIFGNDGEKVITSLMYPTDGATGISVFSKGKATVRSLKVTEITAGK